jgi:hypothetical protein
LGIFFPKHGTIGPSDLLKASGSNSSIPKIGDYHINLTRLHGYVKPGPEDYNVPQLFDNYK